MPGVEISRFRAGHLVEETEGSTGSGGTRHMVAGITPATTSSGGGRRGTVGDAEQRGKEREEKARSTARSPRRTTGRPERGGELGNGGDGARRGGRRRGRLGRFRRSGASRWVELDPAEGGGRGGAGGGNGLAPGGRSHRRARRQRRAAAADRAGARVRVLVGRGESRGGG